MNGVHAPAASRHGEASRNEHERTKGAAAGPSAAQSSRRAKNAAHRADDVGEHFHPFISTVFACPETLSFARYILRTERYGCSYALYIIDVCGKCTLGLWILRRATGSFERMATTLHSIVTRLLSGAICGNTRSDTALALTIRRETLSFSPTVQISSDRACIHSRSMCCCYSTRTGRSRIATRICD